MGKCKRKERCGKKGKNLALNFTGLFLSTGERERLYI
jgi:hypothetical protein